MVLKNVCVFLSMRRLATLYSVDYKQLINTHTAWEYYLFLRDHLSYNCCHYTTKVLSYLYGTFCFAGSKFLSCFLSRHIMSLNDVTIIPTLQFLVARICTPPGEKFHVFGTSNHEKERKRKRKKNWYQNFIYFSLLIRTFCRLHQERKENFAIYT